MDKHAITSVASVAKRVTRCVVRCAVSLGLATLAPSNARADDWGCQVILCLANPGGPEQYAACVLPIERLWAALRRGDPFPTCDVGVGGARGTSASNTFASGGYCREDLLYWGGVEHSELMCHARGAINVRIDGALYARVWWDARGPGRTLSEFYGSGSTDVPYVPYVPYDPARSAARFLARPNHVQARRGIWGGL